MSAAAPGSAADRLLGEIGESLRRPEHWAAAGRELVPVLGVFFFGWLAFEVGVFFLLESWLFLVNRLSLELVFDPQISGDEVPQGCFAQLLKFAGYFAMAGAIFGLMIGVLALFTLNLAFSEEEVKTFLQAGWRRPQFLVGIGVLLLAELGTSLIFVRQAAGRGEDERKRDDHRVLVMFYRCVVLLGSTYLLSYLVKNGLDPRFFVIVIFLVMLYFEACPRDVQRRFGKKPTK
jgi:MFS family permease